MLIPANTVLLEKKRTEFYLARVNATEPNHAYWPLMKIGETEDLAERTYTAERLGFSEVYFQFFVMINEHEYYAFPMTEEAYLQQGFHLKFNDDWTLKESNKITPMPE